MQKYYLKKIFLILFLDLFSFSVIIPLMPLLFLEARYFLQDFSYSTRVIYLGFLYACYPLAQSLASPFWAHIADKIGRRRGLGLSFIGNMLGYLISAYGVWTGQWYYLFVGNMVAGLLGVHISTMNALIADCFEGAKRLKYFGVVQFLLGLAFATGPLVSSWLAPSIPEIETLVFMLFVLAACVALLNALFMARIPYAEKTLPIHEASSKVLKSHNPKESHLPLLLIFLSTFGWYLFIKSFQVFLIEIHSFDSSAILKLVSFYGFSSVVTQGIFITQFYNKFVPKQGVSLALLGLCLSILAFVLKPTLTFLYANIFVITFCQSLVMPNLLNVFSKTSGPEYFGQMMSRHQGIVSMAKILAPGLSGILIALDPALPIYLSAGVIGVVFIMVPQLFKKPTMTTP